MNIEESKALVNKELNKYVLVHENSPVLSVIASGAGLGIFASVLSSQIDDSLILTLSAGSVILGGTLGYLWHRKVTDKETQIELKKWRLLKKYNRQLKRGNNVLESITYEENAIDKILNENIVMHKNARK